MDGFLVIFPRRKNRTDFLTHNQITGKIAENKMYADIEKLLLTSICQAPSQSRIKVQTQQIPACVYKNDNFESLK